MKVIKKGIFLSIKFDPCLGLRGMNKMIDLFKNAFSYIIEGTCTVLLHILKYVSGVQEASDEVVARHYRLLLEIYLLPMSGLFFIPDHLKTQEMCNKEVNIEPCFLALVPYRLKAQGMCDKAMQNKPWLLKYVPDWFVTRQQLKLWDDDYVYNDNAMIKRYDGYKKRKTQKASIKEGLLPITWHPSRYWGWCMSEEEKKETEKLWA